VKQFDVTVKVDEYWVAAMLCNKLELEPNWVWTENECPYREDRSEGFKSLRLNLPCVLKYSNPDKGPDVLERVVTELCVQTALELMAEQYPHHFRDLISENDDIETADVFLQLLVLGDVVYC